MFVRSEMEPSGGVITNIKWPPIISEEHTAVAGANFLGLFEKAQMTSVRPIWLYFVIALSKG